MREQKDIKSHLGAETTIPALAKQQDYEFNIAKVTEIRNLALLYLSLSIPCYTPSHSLILNQILQPLDHFIKFLNSSTETLQ